jgi:hypothetical protein
MLSSKRNAHEQKAARTAWVCRIHTYITCMYIRNLFIVAASHTWHWHIHIYMYNLQRNCCARAIISVEAVAVQPYFLSGSLLSRGALLIYGNYSIHSHTFCTMHGRYIRIYKAACAFDELFLCRVCFIKLNDWGLECTCPINVCTYEVEAQVRR